MMMMTTAHKKRTITFRVTSPLTNRPDVAQPEQATLLQALWPRRRQTRPAAATAASPTRVLAARVLLLGLVC